MSASLTEPPEIVVRPARPYVAVRRTVTMKTMDQIADQVPRVIRWIVERGLDPAGAPFLRYRRIDMEGELDVEAGVPVAEEVEGDGEVEAGLLPEGRYVVTTVVGPPAGLVAATGELLQWARDRGLEWDVVPTPEGERWGCRVESYLPNPAEQPDLRLWRTELALRLRD